MILRALIFVAVSLWCIGTTLLLQCEPTMAFQVGGASTYTAAHVSGWPCSGAYKCKKQRRLASGSSVFAVKYETTTQVQWNANRLSINLLVCCWLVFGIVLSFVRLCFYKTDMQFNLLTALLAVAAICVTLVIVLEKSRLVEIASGACGPLIVLGLQSKNLNQQVFVVLGIFLATIQSLFISARFWTSMTSRRDCRAAL